MLDVAEVGFDRPKTEPLHATVKFYQRHLLICTGHTGWRAHIDLDGGFGQALAAAIAVREQSLPLVVKLTACDEPSRGAGHDILVFPDMVRYVGLQAEDLAIVVEDHLVGNRVSARLPHEPLAGRHVFVCVHLARDARCGYCGPILADLLDHEIASRGLADRVQVHRTSHVGGHQFAANVLIYPEGDWYGYVTPADVSRLIEQHLLRGEILTDLWRGRMGLSHDEQMAAAGN